MGSITQLIYSKKYDLEIIAFGSLTIINDTNECVEVIFIKKQSTFPTSLFNIGYKGYVLLPGFPVVNDVRWEY